MGGGVIKSGGGGGRGGRRRSGGRTPPMAEINVTPFVDVMLVLLIIFMVTAPLLAAGVPVNLPESRANPVDQEPDQVSVTIDREGFIYIESTDIESMRVETGSFPELLESLAAGGGGEPPLINLRADRTIDYGRVMAVMGEINRAGFTSISMITTSAPEPAAMPAGDASESADSVPAEVVEEAAPVSDGSDAESQPAG